VDVNVDVGSKLKKRMLIAWLVLSVLTVGYAALDRAAEEGGAPEASALVTSSAVVIALVKVRIIFREFMEVRHAPALLCRLTDLCVALMAVVMLGSYFIGRAVQ
jgi:hypothetical protein